MNYKIGDWVRVEIKQGIEKIGILAKSKKKDYFGFYSDIFVEIPKNKIICRADKFKKFAEKLASKKPLIVKAEKPEYQNYLNSERWKIKKEYALQWADYRCQICNSAENLNVHHRVYGNVGKEKPNDLTVLCNDCHKKFHLK